MSFRNTNPLATSWTLVEMIILALTGKVLLIGNLVAPATENTHILLVFSSTLINIT
ncbi:hypothetical protein EUBVEN_01493 [Eubacterium ventriosum ATCC 27560]|uniref:Uncharacterized protein n=1 Tax=Eubacterium ventriosum ATCC 27560 TaxID=411463 RepID=A5Z710_9FIRM|nr:hypothetical protein EUBVEN_01493 [Eubacterium ventriosum ATCC 27560]